MQAGVSSSRGGRWTGVMREGSRIKRRIGFNGWFTSGLDDYLQLS